MCYKHCSYAVDVITYNFLLAYHNASFITCSQDIPGTLADAGQDHMNEGFLSFVRLICTVYFFKNLAEFTQDIHLVHCTCHSHRTV